MSIVDARLLLLINFDHNNVSKYVIHGKASVHSPDRNSMHYEASKSP